MEKIHKLFLWGLLAVVMFSFSACSDDDEGGGTGIVSTWEYRQSSEYYEIVQFRADGTYIVEEHEYYNSRNEWDTATEEGTYEFDEEAMELTIYYYWNDRLITRTCPVLQLTSDILELQNWWSGYEDRSFIFRRV